MKELADFAAKHGFTMVTMLGTLTIESPDRSWRWVIYDGVITQFHDPFKKAFNKVRCVDDEEAKRIALGSMGHWLANAERS